MGNARFWTGKTGARLGRGIPTQMQMWILARETRRKGQRTGVGVVDLSVWINMSVGREVGERVLYVW